MSALAFSMMPVTTNEDWELWELNVLKEQYPQMGTKIPELMHRTPVAIQHKANKLGVYREKDNPNPAPLGSHEPWEQWEIDELLDNYPFYGSSVPRLKHRTRCAIQNQAYLRNIRYEIKIPRRYNGTK